ncbi:MAG: hypothetical protein B7Z66_09070 [Chromatiales bacterium 21-64-14]|nr:MAG: hypothetical protein B7Z66_09070 [Chromatiales bacterium 21-64-14]HQU15261.1 hypothetical protein [Gammaproteobacteria bacterium]
MDRIPDFTAHEMEVAGAILLERYEKTVELEFAQSELRLDPHARDLVDCPTLYWNERGCHFVVFKTAPSRYRGQFFYRVRQTYGTGIEEYDDLGDCVLTLVRVQSDHERAQGQEKESP